MPAAFALDEWYRRFGEAVHRRARRILANPAAADDAVQETFLRAHRYRHSYQGGPALPWLFTICDRVCFDALRRNARVAVGVDDDAAVAIDALCGSDDADAPAARPPPAGARLERDQLVARALLGVDDETKQILVHRYCDELDTPAIAAALSTSERTVRRRLADFFAAARRRLDDAASVSSARAPEVRP